MPDRPSYQTCTEVSPSCPVRATTYGYYPDLAGNAFLAAFFGLVLCAAIVLGFRTKTWSFTAFLTIGVLLEFLGYIGRIMMNSNPWNKSAFELQICALVLAPTFVVGSIYLTAKHMVQYCGPQYSRLKPRLYPWVFVSSDIGSILLQAAGGGIAAGAGNRDNRTLLDTGNGLIVAGIAFQVVTMVACGVTIADFIIHFRKASAKRSSLATASEKTAYESDQDTPKRHRNFKIFSCAVLLAYTTILIRCIYRIPEMAGGWGNALMQKEDEFLLLDGTMIAIAVTSLTVVHPGIFFPPMRKFSKKL